MFLGRGPWGDLVAVKVVHARLAQRRDHRERLAREVSAVRGIDSAYVAPVVDHDMDADEPWLATVYLPGLNLREAVETHGPAPAPAVRALGAALARALRAVHQAGTLHRDLTPSNLMLTPDGPRIVDFGIARPIGAAPDTMPGSLLGTPGYIPPERIRDRVSNRAGDVFAFGALLFCAATGEGPFSSGSTQVLLYRTQFEQPRLDALRDVRDRDPDLVETIAWCLAFDPERRPTTGELAERFSGASTTSRDRPPGEAVGMRATRAGGPSPRRRGARITASGRRVISALGPSTAALAASRYFGARPPATDREPRPGDRLAWTPDRLPR
ncbi:serine/threonine protein kinase [Actinomadura sp. KC345]|nr:serine/threonine protein kinase [Actinomadura sp. KC345]